MVILILAVILYQLSWQYMVGIMKPPRMRGMYIGFRLRVSVRVRVGVRVRVSISIYLIDVIKLRIGSVLTNNIRKSALRFIPIAKYIMRNAEFRPRIICGISYSEKNLLNSV